MSKVDVFNQDWIDLVFEGRNQKYGAYQLRRQDNRTTAIALFSGIALMGLAAGIPAAINHFSTGEQAIVTESPDMPTIVEIKPDKVFEQPITELPKPEPEVAAAQPSAPAPSLNNTVQYRNDLAATSEPVPDPPHTSDFDNADPGQQTAAGNPGGDPMSTAGTGVSAGTGHDNTATETGPETTASVDVMPLFPGGMSKFYEQVGRKYRIPETDREMTAKVYVSFIIEKDGTMTHVQVLRDPIPGLGLGKEALRVLESMKTKWTPGKKKGQDVRTAYTLPIIVNIK
ncbi:energy transducer TonB [Flavobacterium psychrotrophum]|uniref:energy transducer TonB n=1 Tax=Flavobacterium psychrotrophum TaxID=2294119 RepID=UPI000E322EBA|nr:energy transducer TonB [Flavobacterium psychrotrophum]